MLDCGVSYNVRYRPMREQTTYHRLLRHLIDDAGLRKAQIAARIGVTRASLQTAANTPSWTPSHPVGDKLIRLHDEVFETKKDACV